MTIALASLAVLALRWRYTPRRPCLAVARVPPQTAQPH
jgi:hypothetical protein